MRLIQFETTPGQRHVGVVEGDLIQVVRDTHSMRELALAAIGKQHSLAAEVRCHRWTTKTRPIA